MAEENKDEQEKSGDWVDVFENGDFCRKTVLPGTPGDDKKPKHGDKVRVKIVGRVNDEIVDDLNDISFILGLSEVVQVWELAVPFMTVGQIDEIKSTSRFAYGKLGRPPDISPDASVHYTLELLSIEPGPDFENLTIEERIEFALARKERGNYYFNRQEYESAIDVYLKGVQCLTHKENDSEIDKKQLCQAAANLYNNLAAAQLKISAYKDALASADRCLLAEPENTKALFRRGRACYYLGEFANAIEAFETLLKNEPEFRGAKEDLARCQKQLKREREKEKSLYRKMVKGLENGSPNSRQFSPLDQIHSMLRPLLIYSGVAAVGAFIAYRVFFQGS